MILHLRKACLIVLMTSLTPFFGLSFADAKTQISSKQSNSAWSMANTSMGGCPSLIPHNFDSCVQQVIDNDPFCCQNTWDNACETDYISCLEEEYNCSADIPHPITDNCVQQVLLDDPFCCENTWDFDCESNYEACISACEFPDYGVFDPMGGCIDESEDLGALLSAFFLFGGPIPTGYQINYLLTAGESLTIVGQNESAFFAVNTPGFYTIHPFIYPSDIELTDLDCCGDTWFDLNSELIQGGGDFCGFLGFEGAQFDVDVCPLIDNCTAEIPHDTSDPCVQLILSSDGFCCDVIWDEVCEQDYQDCFDAQFDCVASIPYPLSDACVQEVILADAFCCEESWDNLCDATYQICAGTCEVTAGTLIQTQEECLDVNSTEGALIAAEFDLLPFVPNDYEVAFVLTQGAELVILAINDLPSFIVEETGLFTIHTFVYPIGLDLSGVEFGVTTGFDINNELIQGGGFLCAALDVDGAAFIVEECPPCNADIPYSLEDECVQSVITEDPFCCENSWDSVCETNYQICLGLLEPCEVSSGTLVASAQGCFDSETATGALIAAEFETLPVIPNNYEVIYILTQGAELIIVDFNEVPSFEVGTGIYTIHTFVYPVWLDLDEIELGVDNAIEINDALIQNGGNLCAALDIDGAAFNVDECPTCNADIPYPLDDECVQTVIAADPFCCENTWDEVCEDNYQGCLQSLEPCDVTSGTLAPTQQGCFNTETGEGALIEAEFVIPPFVPADYEVSFVLTTGAELVILELSEVPSFVVEPTGLFTIHSFVHPTWLDLSFIEPGVTTGFEINDDLIQGGGILCAALDVTGVPFNVEECDPNNIEENFLSALRVYPNPVSTELTIDLGEHFTPVMVTMLDLSGRIVISEQVVGRGRLNVDHLASGMYVLMLEGDGQRGEVKVMVAH